MARVIDYRFEDADFSSIGNGTIIANHGDNGTSNNAIMHTGTALNFDGVDDRIDTGFNFDATSMTNITIVVGYGDANNPDGGYSFGNYNGNGSGTIYMIFYGDDGSIGYKVDSSIFFSVGRFHGETNAAVIRSDVGFDVDDGSESVTGFTYGRDKTTSAQTVAKSSKEFTIGYVASLSSSETPGLFTVLAFIDAKVSDEECQKLAEDVDALHRFYTGVNANEFSSFSKDDIVFYILASKHSGNTVKELVSGNEINLINFPTDDTQWTNFTEMRTGLQRARWKKDTDGYPIIPADSHTIRFD